MPTLLLEIGPEELPAAACRAATPQLPELTRAALARAPLAIVLEGIPSGTFSQAHRFLGGDPELLLPTAEGCAETLRGGAVEPSAEERRRAVTEGLDALGAWTDPLQKLEEVIY